MAFIDSSLGEFGHTAPGLKFSTFPHVENVFLGGEGCPPHPTEPQILVDEKNFQL
jgi:hypothetical protein